MFGFLYLLFSKNPTEFIPNNLLVIIIIAVFLFLVVWIARKSYKLEKKIQLENIFEILDIEVEEKLPEKEWSIKNILTRMFTYPFSFFVISICVWGIFENKIKSIFMAFFGIGICVMYLYSDIKMILKYKNTTSNKDG